MIISIATPNGPYVVRHISQTYLKYYDYSVMYISTYESREFTYKPHPVLTAHVWDYRPHVGFPFFLMETPTALLGQEHRKTQLVAPFYDIY